MLAVPVRRWLRGRGAGIGVGVVVAALTIAVGVSQLDLGVQWASDVLGTWLTGGLWLVLCLTAEAHHLHMVARRQDALPSGARGPTVTVVPVVLAAS